ncbi:MAG: septum formation protein Maf [Candidatus Marinimicrobia bacterium]|nr:septum formation protein Maf [Candidatus Neomarinimicrobiota bacterium]|tara:strand:- start:7820 stop:8431 length:612 start_codon:yes stop_codon:yes gene_type:complete
MNPIIVLASASPRRKHILEKINFKFEVKPSSIIEDYSINLTPKNMAEYWALEKARNLLPQQKNSVVIGADTIVDLEQKILGKPRNSSEAKKMLKKLSGKQHLVHTGVALRYELLDIEVSFVESTEVYFYNLKDDWIDQYLSTNMFLDKAGAYGIQEWSSVFVKKIHGCYNNVVGFPLASFIQLICSNKIKKEFQLDNWFASKK